VRRFRQFLGVSALLAVVGGFGTAVGDDGVEGSGPAGAGPSRSLSEVQLDYSVQYGLTLWARLAPRRDGRLVNATLVAAGRRVRAYVFRLSFDTDEWPPPPHPMLRAGHAMSVHSDVMPRCDDAESDPAPRLGVTQRRPNGRLVHSRFAVVMPGKTWAETQDWVDDVTHQFCSQPQQVRVELSGERASPDGRSVTVRYVLRNPGPGPVTVSSQRWRSTDGARWLPASVVVPPDTEGHRLKVRGVDGICTAAGADTPLELGLLSETTADGERHVMGGPDYGGLEDVCP
jgi:hypothetical protein